MATKAYVELADKFNLAESEVPLIEMSRAANVVDGMDTVMVDKSSGAHTFLAQHPFGEYRKKYLRNHPYNNPRMKKWQMKRRMKWLTKGKSDVSHETDAVP